MIVEYDIFKQQTPKIFRGQEGEFEACSHKMIWRRSPRYIKSVVVGKVIEMRTDGGGW